VISDVDALKAALLAAVDEIDEPEPQRRTLGYFTSWGLYNATPYVARDVHTSGSADRLDHLVYCFANIDSSLKVVLGEPWADIGIAFTATNAVDGVADSPTQPLRGHLNQLKKLKALHPQLRVSMAIGGSNWSGNFPAAAATPATRAALVSSAVDLFLRGNIPGLPAGAAAGIFDGIDIDWEFPQAADKANLAALVGEFRTQLNTLEIELGRQFDLTAWVPANEELTPHWDDAAMGHFDFVVVQGYDLHGPWESKSNFASTLSTSDTNQTWFTCDRAVAAWQAKGIPARDLLLGVPFFCHSWTGVQAGSVGDGLWQAGTGVSDPPTYRALKNLPGAMRRRSGMGAWKYDPASLQFYSVDDASVMAEKAAWVVSNGLGGIATWELSGDTPDAELLAALHSGLSA
jgi:chitinase